MNKFLLLCFFFLTFQSYSQSGDLPFQPGAANGAMGTTQAANTGAWSGHYNPGLMPWEENLVFGVGMENRFLVSELMSQGFAGIMPFKNQAIGLSFASHGYNLYRRNRVGLSYGLKLSDRIAVGVGLNYDALTFGNNYGSTNAVSATIGFSAQLTDKLVLGASVFNVNRAQFVNIDEERIPSILSLGIEYTFSEKVRMTGELQKDINFKPLLKWGLEYHPAEVIYIRTGFKTQPQSYTFGLGLDFDPLTIDMAVWAHPVLGTSPMLSLQYAFTK